MEPALNQLVKSIANNQKLRIDQLHQFCDINSGTYNFDGLAQMTAVLKTAFQPIADTIETKPLPPIRTIGMDGTITEAPCSDALFIRKRPHLSRRILLAGHMDTVFPVNSNFQKLRYLTEGVINGPGVTDMKGGLIVILHALSAFEQNPVSSQLGWDILINPDEEIGSPSSNVVYKEIASHYQAGLIYEPAIDEQGTIARNRKGSGKFTLVVAGKSAHAGRAFHEGRNAICYLAQAIAAIDALNGQRDGVTINVGIIAGGSAINVVPDKAVAKLDVRISGSEDAAWVQEALHKVQQQIRHPDYSLTIHGEFSRPIKQVCKATERLFTRVQTLASEIGLQINWQDTGGCCDGNNLAHFGVPVLDTLGVRGGKIHSEEEYIVLDSLTEQATLSALLLSDLASGGLEDLRI